MIPEAGSEMNDSLLGADESFTGTESYDIFETDSTKQDEGTGTESETEFSLSTTDGPVSGSNEMSHSAPVMRNTISDGLNSRL